MTNNPASAPAAATAATPGRSTPPASPPTVATPPAASPTPPQAPANTGVLEVDDANWDADSAFGTGSGGVSDTTSIMSSIFRYREQNGRTYHAYEDKTGTQDSGEYVAYWLPNDERESERLDLQHNLCILMQDNQLSISPAGKDKPLKRVLDAGCGTGIWTVDFADEHPETAVVGVDISPIQPAFVPPNVEFFIDDLELDWTFVNPFDFVYMRMMTGSIKNWPRLFSQTYEHLNPGGYLEICDVVSPMVSDDGSLKDDSALKRWSTLLVEATDNLGASLRSPRDYKQQLADAGYQNIVQVEYKWPTNTWPKDAKYKEIGAWAQTNFLQALQALSLMSFTNGLGWSVAEVEVLLGQVRQEMKNRDIHAYYPIWVTYAQKPE